MIQAKQNLVQDIHPEVIKAKIIKQTWNRMQKCPKSGFSYCQSFCKHDNKH